MEDNKLKAEYRIFYMYDTCLEEAKQFINTLEPSSLIGITPFQSYQQADQIVVWYWEEDEE